MSQSRLKGLQTSLAGRYAKALFEVACEQSQLDFILSALKHFHFSMEDNHIKDADLLLLSKPDYDEIVDTCGQKFNWPAYFCQFLKILYESRRLSKLKDITRVFEVLANDALGRMSVRLQMPSLPLALQKSHLEDKITAMFGKEMRYEYESIPALLGGFVATVDHSIQIDSSVSTQLNTLHKLLLNDDPLKGAA